MENLDLVQKIAREVVETRQTIIFFVGSRKFNSEPGVHMHHILIRKKADGPSMYTI